MPFEFLECLKFGGDIVMVFPLIPKTNEKEGKKKKKKRRRRNAKRIHVLVFWVLGHDNNFSKNKMPCIFSHILW
jgi:hypothetical protein